MAVVWSLLNQGVGHHRAAAPLGPLLADQPVDSVETGIGDHRQVGQHVRKTDGVVEVLPDAPLGAVRRRQPERILHAQGDAYEQVVLHLGHRHELVRLADAGGEQVAVEHVAAAGHLVHA